MRRAVLALIVMPALAMAETQIMHDHGTGHLDLVFSEDTISFALAVPAQDIVGFEHPAQNDEDRALVAAAISDLSKPLELFVLPEEAACSEVTANVTLLAEGLGVGADVSQSAESDPHSEFQAEYQIQCQSIDALARIDFAYFERFPNAQKLEVLVDQSGRSQEHAVTRAEPGLSF